MSLSRINATAATLTKNRTEARWCRLRMCVTCVEAASACARSASPPTAVRGIYRSLSVITTPARSYLPCGLLALQQSWDAVGAHGMAADSDQAVFRRSISRCASAMTAAEVRRPWIIPGIGSTTWRRTNWEASAIGSALSGTGLTIGENVVGMDMEAVVKDGRVTDTRDLRRRVKLTRPSDRRLRRDRRPGQRRGHAPRRPGVRGRELGVQCVELKWGQGAKNIGGEVKIKDSRRPGAATSRLHRASGSEQRGRDQGIPAWDFPRVRAALAHRHGGGGDVRSAGRELRAAGAKYVFPEDRGLPPGRSRSGHRLVVRSTASDLLTGMGLRRNRHEPVAHDERVGVPPVELHSLLYQYG